MLKGKAINGTISDLVTPKIANVKKTYSPDDTIQYIDISSINAEDHSVSQITEYSVKDAPSRAQQCVKYGDLLVSTVRPINRNIAIVDKDLDNLVASTGFCVLRPNDGMLNYLLSIILSDDYTYAMCDKANGGVYPAVNNGDVLNYQIHIPDEDLAKRASLVRHQADKSKFMRSKSQFIEMFGNPIGAEQKYSIKPLGDCCIINPRRPSIDLSDSDKVSFVPMPSVSEEGGLLDIVDEEYGIVKKGFTYFEDDDVLFAKITPCMENGKGAIAHSLTNGVGMGSTEFHVLRPIEGVSNPYWLLALTRLPLFRKDASKNMKGTGGQKRVGTDYLQNFKVGLPPIEKQIEFEQIYKQADKSKLICLLWNHCHCRDVYTK